MIPFLEILDTLTHVTLTENGEIVMAVMLLGKPLGTEDDRVSCKHTHTHTHTHIHVIHLQNSKN